MVVFGFGSVPPEINSARMYAGPGAGPLLASAAAWDALAVELETFGAQYSSTISALYNGSWSGAASNAMTAAAEPYIAWVMTTAGRAADSASQARAAVAAYEAAFAATVPPATVTANRVLLATLVATNLFGQNNPAIAETEVDYAEMWAQDAAAMYGYAASASTATTLMSFDQPPQTTNPAGESAKTGAAGHALETSVGNSRSTIAEMMSAVPQRLQSLASGRLANPSGVENVATSTSTTTTSTPLITAITDVDELDASTILSYAIPKTVFQGGAFSAALTRIGGQASALPATQGPAAAASAAQTSSSTNLFGTVLARFGRAAAVGRLTVPPNWTAGKPLGMASSEPAASAKTGVGALPSWVNPTTMPGVGQLKPPESRRGSRVFGMRDRRYRMPRPTPGG